MRVAPPAPGRRAGASGIGHGGRRYCGHCVRALYNTEHHHDGLALLTPYDVHHGLAPERLAQRTRVLDAAYAAHPERFVRREPKPATLPEAVWINPPKTTDATQEERS